MKRQSEHLVEIHGSCAPKDKKFLWRYDVDMTHWCDGKQSIEFTLTGYQVVSETPKGFWILRIPDYFWEWKAINEVSRDNQRFVLKTSPRDQHNRAKRWAYESPADAWASFKIRKWRQHQHLENQLANAIKISDMIKKGDMKRDYTTKKLLEF